MTTGKAGAAPSRPGAYLTLDAWRAIASLAVVCFHWSELMLRRWPQLEGNAWYRLTVHGYIGVQIFFVISGYVIANSGAMSLERKRGVKQFVVARVRRIYPTYWVALFFALSVIYLGFRLAQHGDISQNILTQGNPFRQNLSTYAANLTLTTLVFGNRNVPLLLAVAWTLCYELAFYLIVAIGMCVTKEPRRLLSLLHAVSAGTLLWLILFPATCPYPLNLWPQFGLGVLVYDYLAGRGTNRTGESNKQTLFWAGLLTSLTLLLIATRDFYINEWVVSSRVSFIVTLVYSFLLVVLSRYDAALSQQRFVKLLSWFGVFSYSLYLTHTITIRLVNQLMLRIQIPLQAHWISYLLAITVAIAAAYGFFLLFEKPFLRGGKSSAKPITPAPTLPLRDQAQSSEARGTAA